ncbi:MAG: flagellar basal body rod protein FlgC [Phycisphaerae bacterium]
MYGVLDVGTSALAAYRTQLDVVAGNLAMKDAMRFENGEAIPFRRRVALFAPGDPSRGKEAAGVHVAAVVDDPAPFGLRYEPGSPYAIKSGPRQGYVRTSNVDYHTEMVNAMTAARAYEANVTVMETAKSMAATALRLIA